MSNLQKIIVSIIFLFQLISASSGQNSTAKTAFLAEFKNLEHIDSDITSRNFFENNRSEMGLDIDCSMKLHSSSKGYNGYTHHRFKQFHLGIEVYGSSYILHCVDDKVKYANGVYLPKLDLNNNPTIDFSEAIELAKEDMSGESCPDKIQIVKQEEDNLVYIDKYYPSNSNDYILAYQITLEHADPHDKRKYFINAKSGKIVCHLPLIHHQAVHAQAKCRYYGIQDIIVDSVGPEEYILRDLTRGDGITTTKRSKNNLISHHSTFWDLTNEDQDEVALDVHYCAEQMYDYLIAEHNWNGLDNEGFSLNPIVHANNGNNFVNAYWDGANAWFGNGDCHRGPLTTIEVVAHEFMHGITEFSSQLVYRNESGAINESLSDMMGKVLEYQIDEVEFDWFIGESFITNDKVNPFRSMSDPNLYFDPELYKGEYWRDGGGVHTNSGVGNKWFYLLVEGGQGINELDEPYDISGIGMASAAKIVFTTATAYLTSGSDYNDFCRQSKKAAEEIFGLNSDEYLNLIKAWAAVGIPYGNVIDDLDLSIKYPDKDFIISTCIENQFYPFQLVINNNSTTDYLPEYNAQINLEYLNKDYNYPLNNIIPAGDSVIVEISDLFFFDETKDYYTTAVLNFVDFNANNNREFIYISNSILQDPDFIISGKTRNNDCFEDNNNLTIQIENIGCSLPAQEIIYLRVRDPQANIVWERVLELDEAFNQNSTHIYTASFPSQVDNNTFELSIETALDIDTSNNIVSHVFRRSEAISESYINEFESEDEIYQTIDLFSIISFFDSPIYNYLGNNYFASTGYYESLAFPSCLGGEEVLFDNSNYTQGLSSTMELCLDLTNFEHPSLSFDMIQFQNQDQVDYDVFIDYTTMLKISWSGSSEGFEIITAQEEALLNEYKFPLPNNFVGPLKLEFFTMTGTDITDSDFLNYDVILLDNLKISDQFVSSTESNINNEISIFPNPASDYFKLNIEESIEQIYLHSINGNSWELEINNNLVYLDHRIKDGYYFVSLKLKDSSNKIIPLVVIR